MDFNADNNSIFEDLKNQAATSPPTEIPSMPAPPQESLLGNFINSVKNKLEEAKLKKLEDKTFEDLNKLVDTNSETLIILKSFGCKIIVRAINLVEVNCEEFQLKGFMHLNDDGVEMDENCKQIFKTISEIISGGYRIDEILSKYESEEFYPYGEIEQITITYKGQEIKASKGTLMNPKGETKRIIFYKGYEILPDDELAE